MHRDVRYFCLAISVSHGLKKSAAMAPLQRILKLYCQAPFLPLRTSRHPSSIGHAFDKKC